VCAAKSYKETVCRLFPSNFSTSTRTRLYDIGILSDLQKLTGGLSESLRAPTCACMPPAVSLTMILGYRADYADRHFIASAIYPFPLTTGILVPKTMCVLCLVRLAMLACLSTSLSHRFLFDCTSVFDFLAVSL
jgi:hypothetical protein